nr:hypothetical protein [uncultured Draconibacterium sp.]
MNKFKKLLFYFVCACFTFNNSFAQTKSESDHFQSLLLKPEVSQLFELHGEGPVNANGEFQYSINLHSIECKNITIPIDLNYAGRSINPFAYAANCGLNWSVSGEGAIKRTVKGLKDFTYLLNQPTNCLAGYPDGELCDKVGWLKQDTYDAAHSPDISDMSTERKYLIHSIDEEPDIFTCSAPGLYVKFIFNKDGEAKIIEGDEVTFTNVSSGMITVPGNALYFQGSMLPGSDQSYQIEDFLEFELISSEGMKYTFNKRDIVWEMVGSGLSGQIKTRVADWRLTKIVDLLTNEEINYTYALFNENQAVGRSNGYSKLAKISGGNFVVSTTGATTSYSYSALTQWYRLSEIDYKTGKISFSYNSTSRSDRSGDYALKSVSVKNNNNTLITQYDLITSYFKNSSNSSSCLKLDRLDIKPKGSLMTDYSFEYYESSSIKIPKVADVKATDIFGNLKSGIISSNILPSLYFVGSTYSSSNLTPYQPSSYQNYISGSNLLSTEEELKVGMLTQIVFPQKGKVDIAYEQNIFDNHSGNGVRLKSLTYYSTSTVNASKKTYSYSDGNILQFPQFVAGHTFSRDPINIDACNRVFYDWIEENIVDYRGNSSGKTKYTFRGVSSARSLSNSSWVSSMLNSTGTSELTTMNSYFKGHYLSMKTDLSPLSGKIYRIEHISEGGVTLKSIDYMYSVGTIEQLNIQTQSNLPTSTYTHNLNPYAYGAGVYMGTGEYDRKALLLYSVTEKEFDSTTNNYNEKKTRKSYLDGLPVVQFEVTNYVGPDDYQDVDGKFHKVQYYYPADILENCNNMNILSGDSPDVKALKYLANNGVYIPVNIKKSKLLTEHVYDDVIITQTGIGNNYTSYKYEIKDNKLFILPQTLYQEWERNENVHYYARYHDQGADYLDFDNQDVEFNNSTQEVEWPRYRVEPIIYYDSFDDYGNLLQMHKKNDVNKSIFWAYDHSYPVVVAENVSYSTLQNAIIAAAGTSNLESFWDGLGNLTTSTQKAAWKNFNTALRNNSNLSSSLVKTYAFMPLVGMTSEVDEKGTAVFYEYDGYNRLHFEKNDDGSIMKRHNYNYKQ